MPHSHPQLLERPDAFGIGCLAVPAMGSSGGGSVSAIARHLQLADLLPRQHPVCQIASGAPEHQQPRFTP